MRALVFLLVLANLLFYAFSHGLFGQEAGSEAVNAQEINPQQVRIVSRDEPPADYAPPAQEADPAAQAEPASQAETVPQAQAAEPGPNPVCLEWPNLPGSERAALQKLVAVKFPDFIWQETPAPAHSWWVYIPPLANRAGADQKAGELKALGITDYFIVQDGAQRHAISLGIFSSEKSAGEHLTRLRGQGVRSAIVGARPDKNESPTVRLRGPGEQRAALRGALAQTLAQFPAGDCP